MPVLCSKELTIEIGRMYPCWICQGGDPGIPPAPPLPDNGARARIVGYTDTMFPFIDRVATAGGPVWNGVFAQQDDPGDQPWCKWDLTVLWVTINNQDAHYQLRWSIANNRWQISIIILTTLGFRFWNHYALDEGECRPTGLVFDNIGGGNNILTPASVTLELSNIIP